MTDDCELEEDRPVRWNECYRMRRNYKDSVCDQFDKIEKKLNIRDANIEKKIDRMDTKMDKLYMIAFGILASIIGGIVVAIAMYVLP